MDKIVFLGGNGHAIELYEYMKRDGIEIAGYYAPQPDALSEWVPYLGNENKNFDSTCFYVVACGLIPLRKKLIQFIESHQLKPYTYISKRANVSTIAKIGAGAQIVPQATISGNPEIGKYLLANIDTMVAHQSIIGDNVVLSPGAKITGNCKVGDNVTLGSNAALIPGTIIEHDAEIGIGAVPRRFVEAGILVKLPPCEIKDRQRLHTNIL